MFQRILVPSDGSEHSLRAAEYALDMARKYSAKVTVFVVAEYKHIAEAHLPEAVAARLREGVKEAAERALQHTMEHVQKAGGTAQAKLLEGLPSEAIVDEAESGGYSLIVMGSRGLSTQWRDAFWIGSVTERVLRRAPCPVLVLQARH
jgi:nucleotide-binding universal stress UspA family protein